MLEKHISLEGLMRTPDAKFAILLTVFGLLLVSPGWADEISDLKATVKSLEERIHALEAKDKEKPSIAPAPVSSSVSAPEGLAAKVTTLEDEVSSLHDQQDSLLKSIDEKVDLNLYTVLEFENFQETVSSFDARNVELLVTAHMTDRLKSCAEIEFERTATTEEGSRRGAIEVEQGWLEYDINEYFNPRAGVILVPFGKFNLEHFAPSQELTDRPISMTHVVPGTWHVRFSVRPVACRRSLNTTSPGSIGTPSTSIHALMVARELLEVFPPLTIAVVTL